MEFPLGKSGQLDIPDEIQQRVLAQFQDSWNGRLDVGQLFALIDGVLPFEVCLYYQVLPLFVDGNRLHLGMVTPNDTTALEYVRRIISYLNYSLILRAIPYDALQASLTAYLNYTGNHSSPSPSVHRPAPKLPLEEALSYGHYRHGAQASLRRVDPTSRPTLILDCSGESDPPPDLASDRAPDREAPLPPPLQPSVDLPVIDHLPTPSEPGAEPAIAPGTDRVPLQPPTPGSGVSLLQDIPPLAIAANHLSSPVEVLLTLPTDLMLQELLARVLVGGIGRLYFECHPQYGRILWSQNGILQSVLDSLPLATFQALLNELKQTAELPPDQIQQSQQVEIERMYDRARVLLRFRFMVGNYGEEATLQVLRGAALRFYQRQQLSKLQRDALGIAKQLQTKLSEIRERAHSEPGLAGARFESLPALNQLLQSIERHMDPPEDSP